MIKLCNQNKKMSNFIIILSIELIWGTVWAAPQSIPVLSHFGLKAPMDKLELRLRQQFARIHRDAHFGKLTKDQVKTLGTQVEAIRKTEIADMKQNGSKTLTDAQIYQLNQQLDTLSKSIPIK